MKTFSTQIKSNFFKKKLVFKVSKLTTGESKPLAFLFYCLFKTLHFNPPLAKLAKLSPLVPTHFFKNTVHFPIAIDTRLS